jgi:integrase
MAKWDSFCKSKKLVNAKVTVSDIINFLFTLYQENLGYSAINTARSALSLYVGKVDGYSLGEHPIICRFVKAVSRERPPRPKYDCIWDPTCVLELFRSWDSNDKLTLKLLSFKLASLLALCTAQRAQTLSAVVVDNIKISQVAEIKIPKLLKTYCPNRTQPVLVLPKLETDPKVCPVYTLQEYLSRTASLRQCQTLFISFIKPHGPITTQTLSKWLKKVLELAGIHTSFTGHSFRHSATSKASELGVSMDKIYSAAGWTEKSKVFAKHYKLNVDTRHVFATKILGS